MPVGAMAEAKICKLQAIYQGLKKTSNARDDDGGGWFSCSEDEDDQEEEVVQRQEKVASEKKVEADVEAATTFPPAVEPFALPMGSTGAPQQEHVEEGEELQKSKAWLTNHGSGHVRNSLREMGVESLGDLATDAEDEDAAQLLWNHRAPRSKIKVSKPTKEATPLDKEDLQLDFMSEVTENNNNTRSDHGDEKLSHPQVFKAAKDATPPDKEKLDPDFRTEVIETNNNARSDHGGKKRCTDSC